MMYVEGHFFVQTYTILMTGIYDVHVCILLGICGIYILRLAGKMYHTGPICTGV